MSGERTRKSAPKPTGEVLIEVRDEEKILASSTIPTSVFYEQQAPGGLLKSSAASADVPEILTDGGRFPLRGRTLVCTLFEGKGTGRVAKVRLRYELDGYGRLTSMDEEPIA